MDQTFINWLIAAVASLAGFLMKVIWNAVSQLKEDLAHLDIKIHEEFVRRDDFRDAFKEMKSDMHRGFDTVNHSLQLLSEKLDKKEDKG